MTKLTRRGALGLAASVLAFSATAHAKPAKVPQGWDGKKMYETMIKDGCGFRSATPANVKKTAHVFFDTQCPDCIRLMDRILPLQDRIAVMYYPIALLNPHCEPQGALILGSKDPYAALVRHHEHFRDADFRGLRYEGADLPYELRNKVWINTKLHRRSGCRAVPYGVYLNSKGEYVPFDENLTTAELAELFEL